jgi:SAM-dependent methyltransferase
LHVKLLNECNDYSYSQFFPNVSNGKYNEENILCADLSNLPFKDNSFDIFLTSDVFEHLWEPAKCLKEIYRVLKPNGIYLMVFPMDRGYHTTEQPVVKLNDETIIHKQTICGNWKGFVNSPEFHGNPADNSGSIVTYYWGYDVKKFIENNSNFKTEIYFKHDIVKFGIIGVMNEAVVCKKTELDSEYICDVSETKKQYYTISNQVSSD